ncbi:MAG: FtsX-like permease family protein [Gemmatimonadetes bacterium]|nr:FtsX-like permease family protein [Gemmatimonadota bacterium]
MMATLWLLALLALARAQEPALPGMLVERRLADAIPLAVGDTVRVRALAGSAQPRPFVVAGVFEREADPNRIARNDYEVRLHLPDLEALLPTHDRVDRFAIVLAPGARADPAARWIESVAFGTRAYGSAALAEETSATFRVVSRFHDAIGIVTILASAIFLLCVMIIRVDERKRDMGTLRLIGVSRRTVFRAVVLEAIGIAALGSATGALLGVLIAQGVNAYYAAVYDTTLKFALLSPRILLLAGLLGLTLGIAAGALAALRVVRVPTERLF